MPSARSLPIPKYRPAILSSRLPPAKLPIFRARVSHPTLPFAAEEAKKGVEAGKVSEMELLLVWDEERWEEEESLGGDGERRELGEL